MPPAKIKKDIREEFLKTFILQVINKSISPEEKDRIQRKQELFSKNPVTFEQVLPRQIHQQQRHVIKKRIPIKKRMRAPSPRPTQMQPRQISNTPQSGLNLGKLNMLFRDPAVFSVESPGPGKQILVNRSGSIQTTNFSLNKEEIETVMKDISQKTKIPLMSGLFKAVYQNILITSVISDTVGTRFLIQKRSPF